MAAKKTLKDMQQGVDVFNEICRKKNGMITEAE